MILHAVCKEAEGDEETLHGGADVSARNADLWVDQLDDARLVEVLDAPVQDLLAPVLQDPVWRLAEKREALVAQFL